MAETADISPGSEYAKSKLAAEYTCRMAASGLSRGVTVLRLFNPYGFGQSEKLLIGYVTACLHSGKPARIRTPDAQRDFGHVSDVVDALILGAEGKGDSGSTISEADGSLRSDRSQIIYCWRARMATRSAMVMGLTC